MTGHMFFMEVMHTSTDKRTPGTTEIVTLKPMLDEGTRRWQLSPTDIIEEIRQRLRGNYFDETMQQWVPVSDPWMNEVGIGRVSSIMNFYINKNVQLSYFEPFVIENMTLAFAGELSSVFQYSWKEFGIEKQNVGLLAHMLTDTVFASLMRARFGKESQFIENTEQRRIIETEGKEKEGGLLSKIPLLGGKL